MFSSDTPKNFLKPVLVALTVFSTVFVGVPDTQAKVVVKNSNLGVIKGIVRDEGGNPIANAYVSIFRVGTSRLLKQVRSAADGSFLAKILPGTYTVLAVAQGFNPVTLGEVSVNRATELNYGFKLERSGSGNTLPEKRVDRNSSKWRIRAANASRSVYQNSEGAAPVDENAAADETIEIADADEQESGRATQSVVQTYFAGGAEENFTGVNFATLLPVNENSEIIIAAQTGTKGAPQRFETNVKFRPNGNHQIQLTSSVGSFGKVVVGNNEEKTLGQISVQALDEWKVKDGVILVLGMDYSRFVGAGDDFSISPRFGLQFDINSKTRLRSAYTSKTEEKNWANAIDLEGASVAFREPVAVEDFVVEKNQPRMNKSRRLEFGIERVLDNKSSIEANAFFDTTLARGVGLARLPFASFGDDFSEFVANQQGRTQGVRIVYTRRLNSRFSASAGYSFGSGQKISEKAITNPADVFENDFFQTFYSQVNADLRTGTNIKTIFRLSPQATVFAVDPFQGRLAIYDPSLSILVTQSLPTLGLPIRAEAVMDARNLFDFQTGVNGEEGSLKLNSQGRMLRGGILVRF